MSYPFGDEPRRSIDEGEIMRGRFFERTSLTATASREASPGDQLAACEVCVIAREADHRIANHLTMLAGFVRLQAVEVAKQSSGAPEVNGQLVLESIGAQIEMIARLHRALTRGGDASVDLGDHLQEVCAPLMAVFRDRVDLVTDFRPGCVVHLDQILPLAQVVSEALTNAIKHATASQGPGLILASCGRDDGGALQIEVTDNGGGFPDGFDPMTGGGLGFRVMRALSHQLGAGIEFTSQDTGVRFRMTLPPDGPRTGG